VDPLLERLASDENDVENELIVRTLEEIGDTRAVEYLIKRLADNDCKVYSATVDALKKFDVSQDQLVAGYTQVLSSFDSFVRSRAVRALGCLGDTGIIEILIPRLGDEKHVRTDAEEALVKLGATQEQILDGYIRALTSQNAEGRYDVVSIVGKLGDERAVPPLIQCLNDKETRVRWNAAYELANFNDMRAIKPLMKCLERDVKANVRKAAAWALGKLGDKNAVNSLIKSLDDKHWEVRSNAYEALARIGDARAIRPLLSKLKDRDTSVRRSAAETLGKIGDRRAVRPLTALLNDPDKFCRADAARALGGCGSSKVFGSLKSMLTCDQEDVILMGVVAGLRNLGSTKVIALLKNFYEEMQKINYGGVENPQDLAYGELESTKGDRYGRVRRSIMKALEQLERDVDLKHQSTLGKFWARFLSGE
jgi:HEAT repeat protein